MSGQQTVVDGTPGAPVAQGPSRRYVALEKWHAALAGKVALELRHNAIELRQRGERGDAQLADVNQERSGLWQELSERISERVAGVPGREFTANDLQLVRWYFLVQARLLFPEWRTSKQLRDEHRAHIGSLTYALLWALAPGELAKCETIPALRELMP